MPAERSGERLPRIQSLRATVAWLVVGALLAVACGGGDVELGSIETPVCAAGEIDVDPAIGEFVLFTWPDFVPASTIDGFERRYGIDVVQRFYTSNEDMLSQVQARAMPFDLVIPSDYMVDIMRRDGLLLPLDPIALPGTIDLDEIFLDRPYDPGGDYSVPYVWGTVGIGINVNVVGAEAEPTWGLIFDDAAGQFAGRVSVLDDPRQAMAAALMYLGHSPNTNERSEIRAAGELIEASRANLAGFLSEGYAEDLTDGALDVAHGRSDVFFEAFGAEANDYQYLIPSEGALAWVENMAIPITSEHPCTAHSFIDWILEDANAAEVANFTGFASPVVPARELIEIDLLRNPAIYPPAEVREALQFLVDVGDLEPVYVDEFAAARG